MITEILILFGSIIISIAIGHTYWTIIGIKETLVKINNILNKNNIEYRNTIQNEDRR